MGGGGLRILGHKSWHVWRRDNLERVERDENLHEQQQKELQAEEQRHEQEKRAQRLLQNINKNSASSERTEHVNLFQEEEAAHAADVGVDEAACQSQSTLRGPPRRKGCGKPSVKHQMAAIDTLERHGRLPWYATASTADGDQAALSTSKERKRKRELQAADPLQHMRPPGSQASLRADGKDTNTGGDRRRYSSRYSRSPSPDVERRRHRHHSSNTKDEALEERKHAHKRHKSKHKKSDKQAKKHEMLSQLRRERHDREAAERRRAEGLLRGF